MNADISVIKRSGKEESLDINKLHVMVEAACEGLANVSSSQVEMNSNIQFYSGITTEEIQHILVRSASDLIDLEHPNYQFVAARLMLFALRKQVCGRMHEMPDVKTHVRKCVDAGVYDAEIFDFYNDEEFAEFERIIDHDRDYIFTFAGLRQVIDKYLVQDRTNDVMYETPQYMYLLIAATIFSRYPKDTANVLRQRGTTMPPQSTKSTFQPRSWGELGLLFVNTLVVCLLMLMILLTPFSLPIWRLAGTLLKEQESESNAGRIRGLNSKDPWRRSKSHWNHPLPQKV